MMRATALVVQLAASPALHAAQRCTIQAPSLSYGEYGPGTGDPLDSVGAVSVRCTGSPASSIRITLSGGASGQPAARELRAGLEALAYNLFLDAARTRVWGDGTAGTEWVVVAPPPTQGSRPREADVPVYGRIFAWQDPAPGSYSDALVLTVEF
jgi:spore coat protein U-like protein